MSTKPLTDRELQSLRNLGSEGEAAADEIERLTAERDALASKYESTYGAIQDGLLAEVQRLTAERDALRADAERIAYLESLLMRVQFQNQKRPRESVGSDLHMGDGRCSLYVRDLFGNVIEDQSGYGETVREAIDAARKGAP